MPTPPDLNLTPRQRRALELIAERQPFPSADLGAALSGFPLSEWNAANGAALGNRLRELGLVRFSRKRGGWVLKDWKDTGSSAGPSAQGGEIPF